MATKYSDIISIRQSKAAFNICEEKDQEWACFIANDQFNNTLNIVLDAVRGNNIDTHKSFWLNGTYGTGKSHAASVITHLLGDEVGAIREWVDHEYGDARFATTHSAIYSLRDRKRLLSVKLFGLEGMTAVNDLAPVLQKAVKKSLAEHDITLNIETDFKVYIDHIQQQPMMWDNFIAQYVELNSIAATREQLIKKLKETDLGTFHAVQSALGKAGVEVRMDQGNLNEWLAEVEQLLQQQSAYNGMLIVWDEFTDVISNAIGIETLKALQAVVERFMPAEHDTFLFLVSHPNAVERANREMVSQTQGRYHVMKYNMEAVSAFKIMSSKFTIQDRGLYLQSYEQFYKAHPTLLDCYTQTSNNTEVTRQDIQHLYPMHPGTANLSAHYATVIGSASRSVFEFIGQNEAISAFLNSEECYKEGDVISADYLWDHVEKAFCDDASKYGAVTERYQACKNQVAAQGGAYMAIFKSLLLLNAFINVAGENNKGLIVPNEENIRNLYEGTRYADQVDEVLKWINENSIIQREPTGLYTVKFSALPIGEVTQKQREMREVQFRLTKAIVDFAKEDVKNIVEPYILNKLIRPYEYQYYSIDSNDTTLRSQIKNGRKAVKTYKYFFALLVARNNTELGQLYDFAQACANDTNDRDLKNIVYVVFDTVFGEDNYERFIEYQANYAVANSRSFGEQATSSRKNAVGMVKDWFDLIRRGSAKLYVQGIENTNSTAACNLANSVHDNITKKIFQFGIEAHELMRQRGGASFWQVRNTREAARRFLTTNSLSQLSEGLNAQYRPITTLLNDCLDENLNWKNDIPAEHPFKAISDRVSEIVKHAQKSNVFNYAAKFEELTKPPYGLYPCYAAYATMAFALRPFIGKIFDMNGRPRTAVDMAEDVNELFKVWESGKNGDKLNFKFQTPEEGRLCRELISLFGLGGNNSNYRDVSSLKDARYAIIGDFLAKRNTPLWVLKYCPEVIILDRCSTKLDDNRIKLIDNIIAICNEDTQPNPHLYQETLTLIGRNRSDMISVLNVDSVFDEGLKAFLMQIERADVQLDEVAEVRAYLQGHLKGDVGYWSEREVIDEVKNWRLEKQKKLAAERETSTQICYDEEEPQMTTVGMEIAGYNEKLNSAKARVARITTVEEAKQILNRLCEEGNDWVLDMINR